MNDEQFAQKLTDELRRVAIPADLKAQLLELSRQELPDSIPSPPPESTDPPLHARRRSSRRRSWAAAATVASLAACLWLGWTLLDRPSSGELAERRPSEPTDLKSNAIATPANPSVNPSADPQAEIARLRNELRELERAYLTLEQEELLAKSTIQSSSPAIESNLPDAKLRQAEVIYWTAETSLFSGWKTPAVREQLEYLVDKFPDTGPAKRATTLLAEF